MSTQIEERIAPIRLLAPGKCMPRLLSADCAVRCDSLVFLPGPACAPNQAASVGINHATLLRHLYNMAASRAGLPELPSPQEMKSVVSSLAADPFERHDLEGAKAADVCDDDGKTYSYSPPTDLGWDAFRTRLEKGTETIGLPLNQFLMDDDPRSAPPRPTSLRSA